VIRNAVKGLLSDFSALGVCGFKHLNEQNIPVCVISQPGNLFTRKQATKVSTAVKVPLVCYFTGSKFCLGGVIQQV